MPRGRLEYSAEFRQQMVELVRAGRSVGDLAKEFEPTAKSIRNWVKEAAAAQSGGGESLTAAEREELRQLRRENRRLREEREILAKAAAWFAREAGSVPSKDSDS